MHLFDDNSRSINLQFSHHISCIFTTRYYAFLRYVKKYSQHGKSLRTKERRTQIHSFILKHIYEDQARSIVTKNKTWYFSVQKTGKLGR
mmetsp:Transcript_60444/g.68924  ORF Transcript_60444/g.68924 Transcript_60444/m.68924 type:complete len:89 (-) Transcript_60444:2845-3111(-)